jgi:[ribosomal protein S18]-alanine N-acetyltransferase
MTAVARRTLVVRGAEERDLDQVAAIERSTFSDPWTRDALASALHLAHIRFLVAEEAEGSPGGGGGGADGVTLAGYVVALVMGEEGEIADLAVAPAARRRGVGSLLLGRMEQELASCGVRSLYLEVRDSNLAALALYRAHRFEAVGRRRGYYRNPSEDALVLKCDLARA